MSFSQAKNIAEEPPFLPAQATVVLLAGIPGDSESEKIFYDQIQQWLAVVDGHRVSRVLVLSDSPEALSQSKKPGVETLKGDRDHFLGLIKMLSGSTNPLVVIAWGHGSNQGGTPVLHVRGPRLTPEDFVEVANHVPAALSNWVLWFRGSGAFAGQLTRSHAQAVLSSEGDTRFSSDPIGMQLLLKILRGAPQQSLAQAAEALGRMTMAWYSERSLARTEEPTLWLPEEKPKPLISADLEDKRVVLVEARDESGTATHPITATNLTELPTSWKALKKIKEQEYPDADAVILRQQLSCRLENHPAITTEQEQFIQILTTEGKQYGDFDISYSPPEEEIEFLDCEVLRADGKLVRLDPDSIAGVDFPVIRPAISQIGISSACHDSAVS